MLVEYIHVDELHRREGVATFLWNEIKKKWPEAKLTESVSESGKKFLESLPNKEDIWNPGDYFGPELDG